MIRKSIMALMVLSLILTACTTVTPEQEETAKVMVDTSEKVMEDEKIPAAHLDGSVSSKLMPPDNSPLPDNPNLSLTFNEDNLEEIWLAGGCFWGVEAYMARIYGVYDVTSGYANGGTMNPSYREVIDGSGHAETVHVRYDPDLVSLETLLDLFFEVVDPVSVNQQGNDRGIQYRSGIYYEDEADLRVIEQVIAELDEQYSQPIAVEVLPLDGYYLAEDYHQDYLEKNPNGYCHIEFDAIEDQDIPSDTMMEDKDMEEAVYEKPDDETIRSMLSDLEYEVTQNQGTERAFDNKFWDHKEDGIYVDIVTGEPLFSSADKFDSGTGWPSFTRPIDEAFMEYEEDKSYGMTRTEVKSANGESHLGHVFTDGPVAEGGLRFCINSASMRFVPYDKMDEEGYGHLKGVVNYKETNGE